MTEDEIKLAAEIAALQFLMVEVMKRLYLATGIGPEGAKQIREGMLKLMRSTGVPGINPALSDHFSSEVQSAVESILRSVEDNFDSSPQ